MRVLVSLMVLGMAAGTAVNAQEPLAIERADYAGAVACAGKFRWVLDASSGGQPALNEYSLDERVKGGEVWAARAEALAAAADPAPEAAKDIQSVADDTIGAFFDDPDAVEAELLACAIGMGMRTE